MSTKSSQSTTDRQKDAFIQKLAEIFTKSKNDTDKKPASKGGKPG